MQIICTSLQTDTHARTSALSFYRCLSCHPTNSVKALKTHNNSLSGVLIQDKPGEPEKSILPLWSRASPLNRQAQKSPSTTSSRFSGLTPGATPPLQNPYIPPPNYCQHRHSTCSEVSGRQQVSAVSATIFLCSYTHLDKQLIYSWWIKKG